MKKHNVLFATLSTGILSVSTLCLPCYACSSDPVLASMCIMAAVRTDSFNGGSYVLAKGQALTVSQNTALYSLIGTTYGGDTVNFKLPNLAGRAVVGSGAYADNYGSKNYQAGQTGGFMGATLAVNNLPAHVHPLVTATNGVVVSFDNTKVSASTNLSGLTTTTNLANIPFTSSSSSLSIKALSTGGNSGPTSSAYLAKPSTAVSIYTTSAPDTTLAVGSVVGTVSGNLSGTAPGSVSGGSATTTVTLQPGAVSVSGATGATGTASPFSIMSPYIVMNYYIAISGVYPSYD